jgi:hypothetical protein
MNIVFSSGISPPWLSLRTVQGADLLHPVTILSLQKHLQAGGGSWHACFFDRKERKITLNPQGVRFLLEYSD